jgi:hypothetical protein
MRFPGADPLELHHDGFVSSEFLESSGNIWLGYLVNSLANLSYPESKATLAPVLAVTTVFGELPLFLWLPIEAVNADAWHQLARTKR